MLRGVGPEEFARTLTGRTLGTPGRHGKWLSVPLSGGPVLLLHFGMTGAMVRDDGTSPPHVHDRVVFVLSEGELRFRDMRKLRGIWLAGDPPEADRLLASLGPDALTVGRAEFAEIVRTRRQVKATLMDQSAVAGLGNLLADEICWRARVHPRRPGDDLDERELAGLHRAMRRVLRGAIPTGRVPGRRTWLTGRRDDPDPVCPRCGTRLSHGRAAGRTTVWCPRCQPARS